MTSVSNARYPTLPWALGSTFTVKNKDDCFPQHGNRKSKALKYQNIESEKNSLEKGWNPYDELYVKGKKMMQKMTLEKSKWWNKLIQ